MKKQVILGIETSCDETAAAVVVKDGNRVQIVSNIVASSRDLQAKYGGIVPEQAAREQIKSIIPVIQEALVQSNLLPSSINHPPSIDAIAVTVGPGLIGSLLVGVETAKVLAFVWKKPLIAINHLTGHFYANWIDTGNQKPLFPCIGLLVSGGHTDLVMFKNHGKYIYLGGTRDDAAGECFDKCARVLGLSYPGGPEISRLAKQGNPKAFRLPRPMIDSNDFDFSFSGLKTAVVSLIQKTQNIGKSDYLKSRNSDLSDKPSYSELFRNDLCASIEQAIIDPMVKKTINAAKVYRVNQIIVAGGVASNQRLVSDLKFKIKNLKLKIKLHVPPPRLCTDNAAMIASSAFFNPMSCDPLKIQADPNLSLVC